MGRSRCWHKNQGLQLIKWMLWCWALKNVSINSSQQRDSVIFKPSLRTDSRAHGSATLGTNNKNSAGKGGFRKHNQGSTLMSKIAQVLGRNVGAEPEMVCRASLIDACRVKKEWPSGPTEMNRSCLTDFSSCHGFIQNTCVCVNKCVGLRCASTYLANVWGKTDEGTTVPLWFCAILRISPFLLPPSR